MKAQLWICMVWLTFGACSSSGGDASGDGGADPTADAKVFLDAPPNVPASITISGRATETGLSGESAVAGATIAVYRTSDEVTPIAMATTNAQGDYSLTVMTNAAPVDAFLQATKPGYVELYMYPTAPFIADFTEGSVNMMTPSNKDFLNSLAGGNQMPGKGMIGLQVLDANGEPVAGATVSSTPASGAYRYTGSNGLPSNSAMMTSAEGVAFMFNVPSGDVTVTAMKAGMTFKPHAVRARPDKFTTTSVAP